MTKSPFPLLDPIMLGPLLAYLNLYFGTPLPELYVVTAIAVRTHYFAGMYSYCHHEYSKIVLMYYLSSLGSQASAQLFEYEKREEPGV